MLIVELAWDDVALHSSFMVIDVQDEKGVISVAGFGSLLSESSARSTFPDLRNFRAGKVKGYRRIFAHTASVFFQRGIARPDSGEISSLSCESQPGEEIVVSVFDVPGHPTAIQVKQLIITACTWAIPQASAYARPLEVVASLKVSL
jgi:hypothetical protein